MHPTLRFIEGSFHDGVAGEDVCYLLSLEEALGEVSAITIDFASESGKWRSPREALADAWLLDLVTCFAREIAITAFDRSRSWAFGPRPDRER
jgi:hypothetical protein